ncbi:outer membrane protein assembly factor BamD [Desulfobaculum bizertense]|uniref:Beta-barrel assembly machine subunit BamD n=1 Tax=Desulfobaculum bizertense DSM 18034 TaxID=1121442 RepID=A0A1T4W1M4_9BACT|nr:outer membrane protein assembly factor BamD [Desulfobaculum bizertense]UIJ38919.1 outer membrane protein assembly factor BamD [Desulfobaculum bizertense]SKA71039.1 Beta-barrel assembly machine subunit BamD [Desulfobaculum bizertense DSM 18034]
MKKAFRIVAAVSLIVMLTGCGFLDSYMITPPEDTAQELFESGKESMTDKNYSDAVGFFTKLKDRYPFSPYTPSAELALGDAFFMDEKYEQAADAYMEFEALHPRHEEIPYVLYQIGVSRYKSFSSIDKPLRHVNEAMEYFNRVKENYPDTRYAKEADAYIAGCRQYMADHELYVADFYWRTKEYRAAWLRYQAIADEFKDLPEVRTYSLKRSKLSYMRFQKGSSEAVREKEQGSWKNWFEWL